MRGPVRCRRDRLSGLDGLTVGRCIFRQIEVRMDPDKRQRAALSLRESPARSLHVVDGAAHMPPPSFKSPGSIGNTRPADTSVTFAPETPEGATTELITESSGSALVDPRSPGFAPPTTGKPVEVAPEPSSPEPSLSGACFFGFGIDAHGVPDWV